MKAPRLLLLIPPLTQLNTPYPSTAYLTGFLKRHGYDAAQADVGIEMVLALFSRGGLRRVFDRVRDQPGDLPGEAAQILALERAYLDSIDAVIGFLQGQDPALAPRICQGCFLPQGPRFAHAGEPSGAFGTLGTTDRARYLATLYLEDLADLVHETVTPQFALSRYAEHVGLSASSFDSVARALAEAPSLTDELLLDAVWRHVEAVDPTLVGLTVPFPGNLYGALRIAQVVKARRPAVRIVLGGGYVNTELRRVQEPRLFDYVDYVTLDDGERPLLCLLEHLSGKRDEAELRRTFLRSNGRVVWRDGARDPEFGMAELGTPTYTGLTLNRYLSVLLAASGCVAVTAGLEAASDRLLDAMKKGITVAQAARVAASFQAAHIMVHAYLMYGFPGETLVETVETLERVRQLFAHGLIQSAFWHRFVATAHSPIGLDPAGHGVRITGPSFGGFAENDLAHDDAAGQAPEWLGVGLRAALSSYMRGAGVAADVRHWFGRPVPRPKVPRDWLAKLLAEMRTEDDSACGFRSPEVTAEGRSPLERRFVWIGGAPVSESYGHDRRRVILPHQTEDVEVRLSSEKADWLLDLIRSATPTRERRGEGYPLLREVRETYPLGGPRGFDALVRSTLWQQARTSGLLLV